MGLPGSKTSLGTETIHFISKEECFDRAEKQVKKMGLISILDEIKGFLRFFQ